MSRREMLLEFVDIVSNIEVAYWTVTNAKQLAADPALVAMTRLDYEMECSGEAPRERGG